MSFAGELFSRQQLSDALLEPHANIAQRYSTVRVVTPDGETVEGVAMNENKYHVYLMDHAENIRSFRKSTLKSLEHPEQSLMPSYRDLLNTTQLNDLLAYLCTLRKPAMKKTK